MNDEYVNKGQIMTIATWTVMVGLMTIAWVVILATPHWQIGCMFAAMACATSALAATMQIRGYMVRMAALIRATSGLVPEYQGPRPLRDL